MLVVIYNMSFAVGIVLERLPFLSANDAEFQLDITWDAHKRPQESLHIN